MLTPRPVLSSPTDPLGEDGKQIIQAANAASQKYTERYLVREKYIKRVPLKTIYETKYREIRMYTKLMEAVGMSHVIVPMLRVEHKDKNSIDIVQKKYDYTLEQLLEPYVVGGTHLYKISNEDGSIVYYPHTTKVIRDNVIEFGRVPGKGGIKRKLTELNVNTQSISSPSIKQDGYVEYVDIDDKDMLFRYYTSPDNGSGRTVSDLYLWRSEDNSIPILTMEEVDGSEHKLVNKVSLLHNAGFIHGDLYPRNILLTKHRRYHVRLVDFGNSSQSREIQQDKKVLTKIVGQLHRYKNARNKSTDDVHEENQT